MTEHDYVLGTDDEEIDRLGLQHRVWRKYSVACWERAGIGAGSRVLDLGAGPGFATADLAEIVGKSGRVAAFERSERFRRAGEARLRALGLRNAHYTTGDLVDDALPEGEFDAAWCRWVLCFVSDPEAVLAKAAERLRPGARFASHEYVDYGTWSTLPATPSIERFVEAIERQWRDSGGEPNIARQLPEMFRQAGFRIVGMEPIVFTMTPADYAWQWPAAFAKTQPARLVDGAYLAQEEMDALQRDMAKLSANPNAVMLSPMVLEIVAEKM